MVDTAGFNDRGWLDIEGHPHTEALHITERFHRRDFGHMDLEMTIDDPKTFTRPFSLKIAKTLEPDTDLLESVCENDRSVTHMLGGNPIKLAADALARYVGTYEYSPGREARISFEGDLLFLQEGSESAEAPLSLPIPKQCFVGRTQGEPLEFFKDEKGTITGFLLPLRRQRAAGDPETIAMRLPFSVRCSSAAALYGRRRAGLQHLGRVSRRRGLLAILLAQTNQQVQRKTARSRVELSHGRRTSSYLFNPIVNNGVMYVQAKNNSLVALDAATGKELWAHPFQGPVVERGINYWESKDHSDRRLFTINGGYLTAIDARTGQTVMSFGDNGRTDLRAGLDFDYTNVPPIQTNNPGRIFEDIMIVPLMRSGSDYAYVPGDIHAYDVRTGKLLWQFHTVPRPGEFGYDTWPKDFWQRNGGGINWNELTIDEKRGIAFIPTGTGKWDYYGGDRIGQNLFANSTIALDARTGKRLWHFQTVHHDLWDYDLPAGPSSSP